jgi:hypothetical protein
MECGDLSPLLRYLLHAYDLHASIFVITAVSESKAATGRRTPY